MSQIGKSHAFKGVYPVFQTPFLEDESIDVETLDGEISWLYDQGVQGIVMAMVSEVLRLSSEERDSLAENACRLGTKRGQVIISVGAESTKVAVRHAKYAESVGASAVMAIPPTSTSADDNELLKYYEHLINSINIPVIVQDASGYVGRPMSLTMQASLLKTFGERVMYKPEATPIGPRLSALRDLTNGKAHIFEGSGGIALVDSYHRGAQATMPGADMCWAIVALWRALESNDTNRINAINGPLTSMISLQNSLDAFLAVEKYLLNRQQVFRNEIIRGPVSYRLDNETRMEVDRLFELLKIAVQ
ncbi:MAG: dihydrodipicolinate synthase family protein [Acidimicrobiaceae bacterium]|nr:dihydrodipicolinate synthase family protein [Acidimicrobiaceae bacterium]